jgi:hypothetical protein
VTPVSESGCVFKIVMFMLAAVCGNSAGWIVTGQTVAMYKEEYGVSVACASGTQRGLKIR